MRKVFLPLALIALAGCGRAVTTDVPVTAGAQPGRFEVVSAQVCRPDTDAHLNVWVLRDHGTGHEYLVVTQGHGVAVTELPAAK